MSLGLPVFRALSLCTCRRHYPAQRLNVSLRSFHPDVSVFPERVVGSTCAFEDCSAFTRVAACTLALSPIRDTLIEGFSHFVTSMTAPIASGWSGCRVGLAPTGKRRLCTAHTQVGHSGTSEKCHYRKSPRSYDGADDDPMYRMGMTAAVDIVPRVAPHIAGPIHFSAQLFQHINGLSPTSQFSPSGGAGGNAPTRGARMPPGRSICI